MAEEQGASMLTLKRMVRRNRAKHAHGAHHGLNIYPMMDMMTILLVFMVMQFAASTASAITPSEELQIPYTTSDADMDEYLMVTISRTSMSVDGEHVLDLRSDGLVDQQDKQGGSAGFVIVPLLRELREQAESRRRIAAQFAERPFEGNVMIIADRRTPFRTISELIYTLGQAGFKNLKFVSNKTDRLGREN